MNEINLSPENWKWIGLILGGLFISWKTALWIRQGVYQLLKYTSQTMAELLQKAKWLLPTSFLVLLLSELLLAA